MPHAAADQRMAPPSGIIRECRADYATGRADRNLKWGERCATSGPGGPVGYCPAVSGSVAVKEGVDAGGGADTVVGVWRCSPRREVLGSARTTRTCAL